MKVAAPLVLSLMISTRLDAFDAWGFRSGMSETQAAAVAKREGFSGFESGIPATSRFHTVVFSRRGAKGKRELGYVATFCDHKLTWVSHEYQPNIGTLFELLNDLKPHYGDATTELRSDMLTEGRARGIDLVFPAKPDDVTYIGVNLTMNSDSGFGIQVVHHNTVMHCE